MSNIRDQSDSSTAASSARRRGPAGDSSNNHVHDIVCIGFGYNAISLAVALEETYHDVDIFFLERQTRSSYIPFNRLPGSFMQLSFLNDLVTLENPRSRFTYVNYLHSTDQLIQFTNLGHIQPLREQFARYLGWCADQFESKVRFGSEVQAVRPVRIYGSLVDAWVIEYADIDTGRLRKVLAKQVICAQGPCMRVPEVLRHPVILSSVSHSSNSLDLLCGLSKELTNQYHLIVVGNGQAAAEIVDQVCGMRSAHQVTWLQESGMNGADSVDSSLSHRLYERRYSEQVRESDSHRWTFQMYSDVSLKSAYRSEDGKTHLLYTGSDTNSNDKEVACDFIISATGYEKLEYKQLLAPIQSLFHENKFSIDKHRSVNLKANSVEQDCGVWVLGSNEQCDESLARMATTSRYLADSLRKKKLHKHSASWHHVQPRL